MNTIVIWKYSKGVGEKTYTQTTVLNDAIDDIDVH